jgi:hypothetical protein
MATNNNRLHVETITPLLRETLDALMSEALCAPFRLVGGTNLSLRYGHRLSVDIDLFTDARYGSLNFEDFEQFLRARFPYYDCDDTTSLVGFGRGYYIGNSADDYIKLDLMYADPFLEEPEVIDGIRMAGVNDMIAMKMNVVSRGGRKKDFWDLHRLLEEYSLADLFALHARRHEYEHDPEKLLERFTDFSLADAFPDPICLLGKDWDDIKLDLIEAVEAYGMIR